VNSVTSGLVRLVTNAVTVARLPLDMRLVVFDGIETHTIPNAPLSKRVRRGALANSAARP
jgi:hypothetical protein